MTKQVREWAAGAGALGLLFDTVVERSGTGLVVLDEELRYVGVNSEAARINGRTIEEHIGRRLADVVPDVAPAIEPALRRVLGTGRPEQNIDITGHTSATPGEQRWAAGCSGHSSLMFSRSARTRATSSGSRSRACATTLPWASTTSSPMLACTMA